MPLTLEWTTLLQWAVCFTRQHMPTGFKGGFWLKPLLYEAFNARHGSHMGVSVNCCVSLMQVCCVSCCRVYGWGMGLAPSWAGSLVGVPTGYSLLLLLFLTGVWF